MISSKASAVFTRKTWDFVEFHRIPCTFSRISITSGSFLRFTCKSAIFSRKSAGFSQFSSNSSKNSRFSSTVITSFEFFCKNPPKSEFSSLSTANSLIISGETAISGSLMSSKLKKHEKISKNRYNFTKNRENLATGPPPSPETSANRRRSPNSR